MIETFYGKNTNREVIHAQKLNAIERSVIQDLHICPICGTEFRPTTAWVYKRYQNREPLIFCRYNCMRAFDKKRPKPNYVSIGRSTWEQNLNTAHERIKTCRRRIREISAELEYTDLDEKRRKRLKNSLHDWRAKLKEAKETYKQMTEESKNE